MTSKLKNQLKKLNRTEIKKSYAFAIVIAFSVLCTFTIFSIYKIFFTTLEIKTYKPVLIFLPLGGQKLSYPLSSKEKSIYLQDAQSQVLAGIGSNFFRQPITYCDNGLGHRRVFCRVGFYIFEILDRSQPFLALKDQKNSLAAILEDYTRKNSEAAVAAGLASGIMNLSAQEMMSLMSDKKDSEALKSYIDGWAYFQYSQEKIDKNIHSFCESHVDSNFISYCEWGAGRALYVYQDVYLPSLTSYSSTSTLDGYLFSKAFEDFVPALAIQADESLGEAAATVLKKIFYQQANQLSIREQSFVQCINSNKHILDCGQFISTGL